MNKQRLLNVAKALDESRDPSTFDMTIFGHDCGTPACAMGHYAARADLQSEFKLLPDGDLACADGDSAIWHRMREHFHLDGEDIARLFDVDGCNDAETPAEAAAFIRAFVVEHGNDYE